MKNGETKRDFRLKERQVIKFGLNEWTKRRHQHIVVHDSNKTNVNQPKTKKNVCSLILVHNVWQRQTGHIQFRFWEEHIQHTAYVQCEKISVYRVSEYRKYKPSLLASLIGNLEKRASSHCLCHNDNALFYPFIQQQFFFPTFVCSIFLPVCYLMRCVCLCLHLLCICTHCLTIMQTMRSFRGFSIR